MTPRVLSIQSHVVSGYVGNKAAVFPLQLLGFEVDAVHTVHLSNHTGYPAYKGTVLKSAELWEIVQTMDSNGLLAQITHLLTGFVGSGELMAVFERVIRLLRARNPDLVYVCDPVQGDHGILYVSPELPPLFRQLVAHATVLTPNQFEAGLLLSRPLMGLRDARRACEELLDKGPAVVVLTSLDLPAWPRHVTIVAAQRLDNQGPRAGSREVKEDGDALEPSTSDCSFLILRVPRLEAYFTGTGDLLSALLLAHLHREKNSLRPALEVAVATLQTVLADTAAHSQSIADIRSRDAATCRLQELRLVQNAQALLRPPVLHRARELTEEDLDEDDRAAAVGGQSR